MTTNQKRLALVVVLLIVLGGFGVVAVIWNAARYEGMTSEGLIVQVAMLGAFVLAVVLVLLSVAALLKFLTRGTR